MGDIYSPSLLFYGVIDLPCGFVGRGYPERWAFSHFCIDKSGFDIRDIKRDAQFFCFDSESFKIDALKTLTRAVGRREIVAADARDRGDGDEMAMALPGKVFPAKMDGLQESIDIDVHGSFINLPVERFLWFAPSGIVDKDVETSELLGQ